MQELVFPNEHLASGHIEELGQTNLFYLYRTYPERDMMIMNTTAKSLKKISKK
jgi:hypothetical protein